MTLFRGKRAPDWVKKTKNRKLNSFSYVTYTGNIHLIGKDSKELDMNNNASSVAVEELSVSE